MSDFSVRLVALRQQKGYSQEQLALKMGVTKQTISNYERGLRSPDREMMENLANVLDCSVGYLIGTEDEINAQRRLDEMRVQFETYGEKKLDELLNKPSAVRQAREDLADDPDRKALLNLARYGSAQDVKQVAALIDALRATNPDFYDGDDPA